MKALGEVGLGRVLRFAWAGFLLAIFRALPFPPLRAGFLRLCGATIGAGTILHRITLINVDRGGFSALRMGDHCFIGDEVLLDLAAPVVLEDHVTLAARAIVLTHLTVGYRDHPLTARYPPRRAGVTIRRGSFIGAAATILPGCQIGPQALVGAMALVNRDVAPGDTVGGIPVRSLQPAPDQPPVG